MKKQIQRALLLTSCLLCLGWADSWDAIRSNSGQLTSVQADFIQEKHLKILARPLLSKGIFIFQAPASLRWQYLEPVQSLLLMTDSKTRKFSQQNGKLIEDRSMSMDAMQIVSQEISQWLAGQFNDSPSFTARLEPGKMITLTPKEEGLAQLISRIELELSDTPGLMQSVTIYEGEDSFTRIIFSNAVLNQDIAPTVFTKQ
jgi:outer membrane lipoprotein-sorting protein